MKLSYAAQHTQRLRGQTIISTTGTPVIPVNRSTWRVASQSGHGYYTVRKVPKGWQCDCAVFEGGAVPCKHIWAARIWLRPGVYASLEKMSRPPTSRHRQDWPSYDEAQQAEHVLFEPLLWSLLDDVPEPLRAVGAKGRPAIPLRTQLLMAVRKVHLGQSTRRARGLLQTQHAAGNSILPSVPNYAVPSRLFNRPDVGPILLDLIRRSAHPLRELEDRGTVAIDSTGFCTTCMGSYCTETHDPGRRHRWVKAHVVVGVKTHVIVDVRVTDEFVADCPQFVPLLQRVKESGFNPSTVVADKAYLSRENYNTSAQLGINAFVPFKTNSTESARGSLVWRKMYFMFQLHREEFDRNYHARSNVEAVFSAIKRKLGESLLSKNPLARCNELLARLLAYNIGILVHRIHENGISPGSIGLPPRPPIEPGSLSVSLAPTESDCDFIGDVVTELGGTGS